MKNTISSLLIYILWGTIAFGQQTNIEVKRYNEGFELQNTVLCSEPVFYVFTHYDQMSEFFKPTIVSENNAVPVINSNDFLSHFIVAISGSKSGQTKPLITTIQQKNRSLLVYYEEVSSRDVVPSSVVAIKKGDFKDIVFVDRISGNRKVIYYSDVAPVISKIILSYLDMSATDSYKHEYQISVDKTGEIIVVKNENGRITNLNHVKVSTKVFKELTAATYGLDSGEERIDRDTFGSREYREIMLLDNSGSAIYTLTWDSHHFVNEVTRKFVQIIENLVPEIAIRFSQENERNVARN